MALSNARFGQEHFAEDTAGLGAASVETVAWDDQVKGLGLRTRGSMQTWIQQWRVEGRSRKMTFGTASDLCVEDARRLARDVLAESKAGALPALTKSTTMNAFADRFLKDWAGQWKPSTLKTNRNFIKHSILPVLELWEIRSPDSNPCRGMRKRKSDFVAQYLSEQEFARLGRALREHEDAYPDAVQLFRFLVLTGCRLGEARGLKWAMIDGHRAALPDAKGGPSAIWLGAPVRRLLASRPQTDELVFVTDDKPITTYVINTAWIAVREAAHLPKLRLHDLRHNFAKVTVTLNYDLRVLKDLLGHKDLATTQGCAHLDVATVKKASARVARHIDRLKVKEKRVRPLKPPKLPKPPKPPRVPKAPKPFCHYSRFVRSKHALRVYCDLHGLAHEDFRLGLIAWRAENGGPA